MYIMEAYMRMSIPPAYLSSSGSFSLARAMSLSAMRAASPSLVDLWMSTKRNTSSMNHLASGSALLGTSIMNHLSPICSGNPFLRETNDMTTAMSLALRTSPGLLPSPLDTARMRHLRSLI